MNDSVLGPEAADERCETILGPEFDAARIDPSGSGNAWRWPELLTTVEGAH